MKSSKVSHTKAPMIANVQSSDSFTCAFPKSEEHAEMPKRTALSHFTFFFLGQKSDAREKWEVGFHHNDATYKTNQNAEADLSSINTPFYRNIAVSGCKNSRAKTHREKPKTTISLITVHFNDIWRNTQQAVREIKPI